MRPPAPRRLSNDVPRLPRGFALLWSRPGVPEAAPASRAQHVPPGLLSTVLFSQILVLARSPRAGPGPPQSRQPPSPD